MHYQELRQQTTAHLPLESTSYEEMEWLDLFKKKSGGSDWGDVLMEEMSTEKETPKTLQIEDTFEKLTEWKSSPFCIVDEHDVLSMIKE